MKFGLLYNMQITEVERPERNIGLDFGRSAAIILVLIAHFSMFFSNRMHISPIIHGCGFFGVELFFVLSGFLIGRILILDAAIDNTFVGLIRFWKRRWYRTLPAYYLVWCVLFVKSGYDFKNLLHLFMLQNFFYEPRDLFFGVSWSLAAEEWFYFLCPLLLYLLFKLRSLDQKKILLGFCLFGIILAPVLRLAAAILFEQKWGDIRKSSFIRLDAFLFGILLAAIQCYYLEFYNIIAKQKKIFILISGVGLIFCAVQFRNYSNLESLFNRTILFSIVDFIFALVIIILESENYFLKLKNTWKQKIILWISITSYSVYLIHWDLMLYFRSVSYNDSLQKVISMLLISIVVTYVMAFCIYIFWEKPFLALRDANLNKKMFNLVNINNTIFKYVRKVIITTALKWKLNPDHTLQ
jgi:peptidoglycan/LPS O-acetylase OafA/YrhL